MQALFFESLYIKNISVILLKRGIAVFCIRRYAAGLYCGGRVCLPERERGILG